MQRFMEVKFELLIHSDTNFANAEALTRQLSTYQ